MQIFPPPGPRLGLPLVDLKWGSCSSPSLVLFRHGGTASPVQVAPQGGQDVLDSLLSLMGPAGWSTVATFLANICHGRGL